MQTARCRPACALEGRRIVVLDDAPELTGTLCELFRSLGADAEPVTTCTQAMSVLSARHTDALVSDLVMPRADGYDIARWARMRPRFDALQLVALSGLGGLRPWLLAAACGFDVVLSKPADVDMLVLAVMMRKRAA
ncbi:MAG: response regulator [Luteimonas sp.]